MKKIILLLIVLVPFSLFGQAKLRKGYIATQDGDSISCLYQNGLWVLESDTTFVIKVDTVEFPDGTKLFTASTETVGTRNGAYKSGNFIEFGTNPLIKDTDLPGSGFDLNLGTTASKLDDASVNADDIKLNANNKISIRTNDVFWEWYGDYITGQRFGAFTDTLISKREVEDLISQINVNVIQPWNFEYEYGATYDDSRPGAGLFKMNNAFIPSVTQIYIDDFDLGGTENSSLLQVADTGSYFFIYNKSEETWRSEVYAIFQITGGYESNSGYTTYNVVNIYNNDPVLSDGDVFELVLEVSNSTGSSGGGSVDAGNAAYNNSGTIEFGTNPLYKNTEVPGASYNLDLGTTGSKLGKLTFNADEVDLNSDNGFSLKTGGSFWEWYGNYITGQRFGAFTDTLISAREVRDLIADAGTNVIQSGNFEYEFVSTLTDTRPGVTTFSFNSAVASSVTRINIDDFDINSMDKSDLLQPVDTGSYLFLFNKSAQTWPNQEYLRYKITGGYVDESGYTKYNVTFIYDGGVDLAEGDVFTIILDQSNSTGSGGGSVADSSWYETNTTVAKIDTLEFANGKRMTNIPQNDIFLWDSTNSNYKPYPSLQADSWYYGFNSPTGETRINWSGVLRASGIQALNYDAYSGSALGAYVQGRNAQVAYLSYTGDAGDNITNDLLTINRSSSGAYDLTGDVININDSPSATGTVSGSIISATIDGTERIKLNPRAASSGVAHSFDTKEDILTGSLLQVKNQGTTILDVKKDSIIVNELHANTLDADTFKLAGEEFTEVIELKDAIEAETLGYIKFATDTNITTHVPGRLSYDSARKQLVLDDDISGKWNISAEVGDRFFNPTASQIDNGKIVRITGDTVFSGYHYSKVELAGISSDDSTLVLGAATTNLPSLGFGRVTFLGRLNDLETTNITGLTYLGFAGERIDTSPQPPYRSVCIGQTPFSDATEGYMYFNPQMPTYAPNPTFTALFKEESEIIENSGIDIYDPITNATNDLFGETRNVGFIFQGDSISPNQDGNYTIFLSYSFQGTASQTDIYRIGTFINGTEGYSTSRTASGTNNGGVPYPYTAFLNAGDWISFKVMNQSTGTRDCTFTDGTITINFSE